MRSRRLAARVRRAALVELGLRPADERAALLELGHALGADRRAAVAVALAARGGLHLGRLLLQQHLREELVDHALVDVLRRGRGLELVQDLAARLLSAGGTCIICCIVLFSNVLIIKP